MDGNCYCNFRFNGSLCDQCSNGFANYPNCFAVGETGFCTDVNPCKINEGNCENDNQCQSGLLCGNCHASLGFDSIIDCCGKFLDPEQRMRDFS